MASECKYCQTGEGDMISCASCKQFSHPVCLELPEHIVPVVKTYDWQCNDCKYCYACHCIENEKKILFCDSCDRGFHMYCLLPPLFRRPKGDWFCSICVEMQEKAEKEKKEEEEALIEVDLIANELKKKKKKKENIRIEDTEIVDLTESQRDKRKNERDKSKDFSPIKGNEEDEEQEEEEKPDIIEEKPVTPVKPAKRKYTKSSEKIKKSIKKTSSTKKAKKVETEMEDAASKIESIKLDDKNASMSEEKVDKKTQTIQTVEKQTQTLERTENKSKPVAELNNENKSKNKDTHGNVVSENKSKDDDDDDDIALAFTKAIKSKCLYAKTFSNMNQCPFFGCDGTGNTRNNHNNHVSLSNCPLSRESRRREKELLGMCNASSDETTTTSPSHPRKELVEKTQQQVEVIKDSETNGVTQTPIENIVSESDIEMFEAAKKKALLEMRKEMAPNPDGLKSIIFGNIEIEAWYKSQYAPDYSMLAKLYICEFCLDYMKTETIYQRHMAKCTVVHPPGDEIYRKDGLSVFEIDGAKATVYCQNLCLMSKLFLDHKTLWADVAPFLFYIMTKYDERGCHIVGYFSKEKVSFLNYNVSCILVLPHHMRMGYGRLLIDFSYLLTAVEGKTGSPERPFSDMGLISYRKFWAEKLLNYISTYPDNETISIKGISEKMAMQATDVISTLQYLGMLKYWKGKHVIALRTEVMAEYALKVKQRPSDYKEIDVKCLTWTPPSSRITQTTK